MNRQRVIVALLAVFCVLLALNLVKGEPEAQAEPQAEPQVGTGGCCVSGECFTVFAVDCTAAGGTFFGVGVLCGSIDAAAAGLCPPLPTVVAGAVVESNAQLNRVYRFWTDGTVDVSMRNYSGQTCTPGFECGPVSIIPPPCPADVTADGTVNVLDLVDLLLAFGMACP